MANVQSVDQVANWNAPPQEGSYYPFALAEEADEDPVNSGLLSMLLLAGSFLGASVVGWLHTRAREDYLPFLGVFRL